MTPPRRRAARRPGCLLVGVVLVLAAILATIVQVISFLGTEPAVEPPAMGCRVQAEGLDDAVSYEQAGNITIIVGEAIRRGLPARASTIAVVTAYQESDLHNLDYGDRDSLGLFQQRPSQGWGTPEQVTDPWYASGMFYEHLVKVDGWESGDINDVAQQVQRSGYPHAYGQHESAGRVWASALNGFSPAAVSCIDREENPGDAAAIADYLARVWGESISVEQAADSVTVEAPTPEAAWSIGQVAVLLSQSTGVTAVQVGEQRWELSADEYATWQPASDPGVSVVISLRTA